MDGAYQTTPSLRLNICFKRRRHIVLVSRLFYCVVTMLPSLTTAQSSTLTLTRSGEEHPGLSNASGSSTPSTPDPSSSSTQARPRNLVKPQFNSRYLKGAVDPDHVALQLSAYCIMSGWMCVPFLFFFFFFFKLPMAHIPCPEMLSHSPRHMFGAVSKQETRFR
jgi:hypothetical protein